MARRPRAMISAHRCLTRIQVAAALELDVDFVEFDVQRCVDGALVLHHDPTIVLDAGEEVRISRITEAQARELLPGMLTYDEVLAMLAGHRRAHIDLKASAAAPATAIAAVARAVEVLGADGFVVTTGSDETVRAVRDWGDEHGHELLAGISLGRNTRGFSPFEQLRIRWSELRPRRRVDQARASVVVAHHSLALLGVARFARRHRLPLLVWTVDTKRSLAYWMRPGGAWLVTTNRPSLALDPRPDKLRP